MRKRILALIIVAVMICPTSFAAFAASEIEVTQIKFTDEDKTTEISNLYDCDEGVGCNFSYEASAENTAYGLLMFKRNDEIISYLEQTFVLEEIGTAAFDEVLVPVMEEAGVYKVCFMLFDSKESMNYIDGSSAEISCEIYPEKYEVTAGIGYDFEGTASVTNLADCYLENVNVWRRMARSSEVVKNGNYSLAVPVKTNGDRLIFKDNSTMLKRLKALGDGRYRVCGYAYPTSEEVKFLPRLSRKNSALNDGKEYAQPLITVACPPGKWTYFSADYDVVDYLSTNVATTTSILVRLELYLSKLTAEQTMYYDDIKVIKLEEGIEEMASATDVIVKSKVAANEKVIVTAESKDKFYAVEAVTADENGVIEAQLSINDSYWSEDIIINVYGSDGASAPISSGVRQGDTTYLDFRYFSLGDINGVKINSIEVNDNPTPYDEIVLLEGNVKVSFDIKNDLDKKLRVVAARYNNGMFKSSAISDEGENSILIKDVSAQDTIEFFLVDDKMTLTSHLYTLSEDGLTETEVYKSVAKFESLPVASYNTVTYAVDFDGNVDADSFVIFAAYPSAKTEDDDYAYIGVKKLDSGDNHVSLCIDKESYPDSCTFELDYYTTSADVSGSFAPYDYVSEKDLLGYFDTLNTPESTTSDIYAAISAKPLKINMGYYNSLSYNSKAQTKALELFMEYNDKKDITNAADVQSIFDEALATVILSCSATDDAIEKLGDKIPLNEEYFANFKGEESGFKKKAATLISTNAVTPENATKEKANELFEDAYVTAQLKYNASTYGAFMKMATETYAEIVKLDMSEVSSSNKSDVFKYMFENRLDAKNIAEITELYDEAIDEVKEDDDNSKSSSVSKRGGGGGSYVKPSVQDVVPVVPTRTKFTDMQDSHWAIESVLFLNGIGVISDAESYRPNDCITREEVVKMLICSFGELDESAQCDFSDVEKEAWSYPYIASAYKTGMVNGIDEKSFGIGRNISRQDALVMIYRIIKNSLEEINEDYVFEFSDESSVSDYALEAVKTLCANDIVNGYEDGTFKPAAPITRAECAKLLTTVFRR